MGALERVCAARRGERINVGADLSGIADPVVLLTRWAGAGPGLPSWLGHAYTVAFAVLIVAAVSFGSYAALTRVFKWLALALLTYVVAAVLARPDWAVVLRGTLVPGLPRGSEAVAMLVAIFGTTISPYLFFWQAAQNAE